MNDLDAEKLQDAIKSIEKNISENKIILYMKGDRQQPRCGFSNLTIEILNSYKVNYETVDVLQDMYVREGIKKFSDWPTIPQLYVNSKFIGGSDIVKELHVSKKLQNILE